MLKVIRLDFVEVKGTWLRLWIIKFEEFLEMLGFSSGLANFCRFGVVLMKSFMDLCFRNDYKQCGWFRTMGIDRIKFWVDFGDFLP